MTDSPLVRVLEAHWLAGVDCDHATRHDRARCACSRVDFGWQPTIGAAVQTWIAHVVTLVSQETQAELARQFPPAAGTATWRAAPGLPYAYRADTGQIAGNGYTGFRADPGFPVLPAVAWPKGWPR